MTAEIKTVISRVWRGSMAVIS